MDAVVTTTRVAASSPRVTAKVAGLLYLFNTLTIFAAIFCFRGIIVAYNPAVTATNVLAHEAIFRLGFSFELISTVCSVAVAALFYELLKPVNTATALVAAFFRLMACAVAIVGYVFQLAPLQMAGDARSLSGINVEEVSNMAFLLYRLHGPPSDIVIILFGFHFVLIGFLIFKSTFMPRMLGIVTCVGGLAALIFLVPPVARYLFPYIAAIGLVVEVSLRWCRCPHPG